MTYDFSGYATKHNVRCSDGRTIMPGAFQECDGQIVPLVWQHDHDSPSNVIGHAELENRSDGVYAYCSLNSTRAGKDAKEIVKHGDICALSIYANKLRQQGQNVMHGVIREVSLVLAGANPGATIDNLAFAHSDGTKEIIDDEAFISFVGDGVIIHADEQSDDENEDESLEKKNKKDEAIDEADEKTIEEIIDTMNDEQKAALYAVVAAVVEDQEDEDEMEHADSDDENDSDGDETIQDVLDTLDEKQTKAVNEILDAISNGKTSVSDEAKDIFESLSEKQKNAVYAIVGMMQDAGEMQHADDDGEESDETIQDVLDTLDDEQSAALDKILEALENGDESVPVDVADVFDTFTDKQKDAVYALVGMALEEADKDDAENQNDEEVEHYDFEGASMKYNVFDQETGADRVLSHSDIQAVFSDAQSIGSLKDAALAHGIQDIEVLFPEAQPVNAEPYMLAHRMEWVSTVLDGVKKSPFSRIKSTAANLTEAQARAKGYIKGNKKLEEQITALRRVTTPQTIYKLQKLDRDDVIDITDFDVVAWMKQEMRMMLDEELARAILVGDGRLSSDPDKIFQQNIRSIWEDDEMYAIHRVIPTNKANDYSNMIDEVVRSRVSYKGSGNPKMFTSASVLTEMRLLKKQDSGEFLYDSDEKLAQALRVSSIEEVELFDDLVRNVDGKQRKLVAIIVNPADYTVGASKGGEVSLFDDFDLNFNKYEYLIETRCCGALTMPKSAIVIEIQLNDDAVSDPTYERVTSPSADDIDNYYERDEYGRYVKTNDSAIVTGKAYYTVA